MLRLFEIEFYKLRYSKTFWVICAFYALLIIIIPLSVSGFLDVVKMEGGDVQGFDPAKIPVLHFPDIWQNVIFIYGFIRIFLGILVIISVSNEYSYRTIRQNVIDGMSREDFIISKLVTFFILSLSAAILVFCTLTVVGLTNTPQIEAADILYGLQFVGAYFLELFTYMALALFITVIIQRTGLSIAVLLLAAGIEYIIGFNIPETMVNYLPMHALENLVTFPYGRYVFREIQDYVSITSVLVVLAYLGLFIYGTFAKLKSSDI
jgi:ABC-2 type transport system permease protein